MVSNQPLKLFLILTLTTLACGLPTASPSPIAPPLATIVPVLTSTLVPTGLTLNQINNVLYPALVPEDGRVFQMVDGKYQSGTDPVALDFAYVAVTQFVAFGDLTNDGVDDAAVIFLENYGGTGNFGVLAVYVNVNGEPVFLHSTLIDDRPMINSIAVEDGEIFVDAVIHGLDDGGCCPTLPTTRRYALVNSQLRFVNYTTNTPAGAKREIEITSPANGTEVSGSVQVSGNVSIAPFENNLTYFIYDEGGNQYAAGPVAVAAPDLGAPGTFSETFTLEDIPAGTTIYLEIQDISAADGSWLAMDAVKLLVK